jgi:hypothetical protein
MPKTLRGSRGRSAAGKLAAAGISETIVWHGLRDDLSYRWPYSSGRAIRRLALPAALHQAGFPLLLEAKSAELATFAWCAAATPVLRL